MFLLDVRNSEGDGKTLLLSLYFLMQFLRAASVSFAGTYSELDMFVDTSLLLRLHMAPLYLYLALRLKGRWKVPLSCAVLLWSAYEVVWWIAVMSKNIGNADIIGPGSMIICLAVLAALGAEKGHGTESGDAKNQQENEEDRQFKGPMRASRKAVLLSS